MWFIKAQYRRSSFGLHVGKIWSDRLHPRHWNTETASFLAHTSTALSSTAGAPCVGARVPRLSSTVTGEVTSRMGSKAKPLA